LGKLKIEKEREKKMERKGEETKKGKRKGGNKKEGTKKGEQNRRGKEKEKKMRREHNRERNIWKIKGKGKEKGRLLLALFESPVLFWCCCINLGVIFIFSFCLRRYTANTPKISGHRPLQRAPLS
jgi:hypothetical protein